MKILKVLCLVCLFGVAGCTTSRQLADNTLQQGKSLTDLEYEMVLDNIAMFKQSSGALPWHAIISKGSITVNDLVTAGAGYKGGPPVRSISASASRAWQGDWTFTPVVDPIILGKLRTIYRRASQENWFQVGSAVPETAEFSGHYGATFVWVAKANVKKLTETTTNVLTVASSVTTPWLVFKPGGIYPFISRLQKSDKNGDFPSQFLANQLSPGVKTLVSNYKNTMDSADTTYWLTQALESALNKTIASWTTNDVCQLAASIQMANPGTVSSALRNALNSSAQSNELLERTIEQIANYYSGVFEVKQNTYSVPFQNNLLLLPGGPVPIQN